MTHSDYLTLMLVLWSVVAVLGAVVAAYALLAWRRRKDGPMLALAGGLLLLSVGPAIVWMGIYGIADSIYTASEACVGLMAVGFGFLVVSVRARVE